MDKRTRAAAVIMVVVVVLFLGWLVVTYLSRRGLDKLVITAIPSDSTVLIDNKPSKSGTVYVKPGKHTLKASRDLFDPTTKNIDTRDTYFVNPVYLLPGASSDKALQWLKDHPAVQAQREAAGGVEDQQAHDRLNRKYPILQQLPAENSHYKIDYSLGSGEQLSFVITLYAIINDPSQYAAYKQQLQTYKAEALQYLKANGIDTAHVTITYTPNVPAS